MKLTATVHWEVCWLHADRRLCGEVRLPTHKLRKYVQLLLDAGIPIKGYWADINYSVIDPRITNGMGRR